MRPQKLSGIPEKCPRLHIFGFQQPTTLRTRQTSTVKKHWNQVTNIGPSKSCLPLKRDLFTKTVRIETTLKR
jgi:hypothetical protein